MKINLGILPWANLDSPVTFGRVTYIPWSQQKASMKDVELVDLIQSYLSIYKGHGHFQGKFSEVDPVVVLVDGNINIQLKDVRMFYRSVNLFFFLVTAWDDMTYINNNAFEAEIRTLDSEKSHFAFGPRRAMTIAADYRDLIVTEPLNSSGLSKVFGVTRHKSYVDAVAKLQKSRKHGQIADASLSFYRLAFDDHYAMDDYLKLSLLISAFETLLRGKGNKDSVIVEVTKKVISKKRLVVYDRYKKKRLGFIRPAGIIFKAYDCRNGYMHNGERRGLGVRIDGQLVSLWTLAVYVYQQYFLQCLDDWKLLKLNDFERYFILDSKFDKRTENFVDMAELHNAARAKRKARQKK